MVTPELERAYARRGIPLIDPDAGVAAFLDELAHGTGGPGRPGGGRRRGVTGDE